MKSHSLNHHKGVCEMKLAFSTLASPNWTWQESIQAAKTLGYDGVEWRLIDNQTVSADFPPGACARNQGRSCGGGAGDLRVGQRCFPGHSAGTGS